MSAQPDDFAADWTSWTAEEERAFLILTRALGERGPDARGRFPLADHPYHVARRRAVARACRESDRGLAELRRRADRGDRQAASEVRRRYREASDLLGRPLSTREAADLAFRAATGFEPYPSTDEEWAALTPQRRKP